MKPYGKTQTFTFSCKCCSINISPRQHAKNELRKLIEEESDQVYLNGYTVGNNDDDFVCGVCGKLNHEDCAMEC